MAIIIILLAIIATYFGLYWLFSAEIKDHKYEIMNIIYEYDLRSAKSNNRISDKLDYLQVTVDKVLGDKKKLLTASDRGKIDDIIFALRSLGNEKMISYTEEIELLLKLKNL